MYKRLNENRTKRYYREIIQLAIEETRILFKISPGITIYFSILNQLIDINERIIKKETILSEEELYNRYSIGSIAVKNFDIENDEYAQKLSDSFGGTFDYDQMPEE